VAWRIRGDSGRGAARLQTQGKEVVGGPKSRNRAARARFCACCWKHRWGAMGRCGEVAYAR
jgi:hypothetical protein